MPRRLVTAAELFVTPANRRYHFAGFTEQLREIAERWLIEHPPQGSFCELVVKDS
jgi:hypothetical protein